MKKSILVFAVTTLIIGSTLTSCNTTAEKVENAEEKVTEANVDLDKANKEYIEEIVKYRVEKAEAIAANEKSIAEFKARIEKDKKGAKAEYVAKVAELEKKNTDMKYKMDNYKEEGKEGWILFRDEFTHDMIELAKAVNEFNVNNTNTK
ncbi:MAG: hypothetical protein IPG89_08610 [Bacteroidetes bacterium]|nr:hypothetical protein [Bacteroidota bacterium]